MSKDLPYGRGFWELECLRVLANGQRVILVVERIQSLSGAIDALAVKIGPAATKSSLTLEIGGSVVLTTTFGDKWWSRFKDDRGHLVLHSDIYRDGKMFNGLVTVAEQMQSDTIADHAAAIAREAYDRELALFNNMSINRAPALLTAAAERRRVERSAQ